MQRWMVAVSLAALVSTGQAAAQKSVKPLEPPPVDQPDAVRDAFIPVEITDAPLTETEGVLTRGRVVAQHQLRARDAVVLTAPFQVQGRREIPAGTALALTFLDPENAEVRSISGAPPADRTAWCDVRPTSRLSLGSTDCLRDGDVDGRFDQVFTGTPASSYFSVSVASVLPPEPIAPVGYRPATLEERPATRIGWQYCSGDGVSAPPRFAAAVAVFDGAWDSGPPGQCGFGAWPDAQDRSVVAVDRIRLRVTPGAEGLAFQVLDRVPPGAVASPRPGGALLAAVDTPSEAERVRAQIEALVQPPFRPVGEPRVADRAIRGGDILTVPVAYGVTGVLQSEARQMGLFARDRLPVGQPVFGVPMFGSGGAEVVWCAPRAEAGREPRRYRTTCLPQAPDGIHRWVSVYDNLFARSLSWNQNTNGAEEPVVERREVDVVGPMTLSWRLVEWDSDDIDINLVLSAGEQSTVVGQVNLPREPGQPVELRVLGGVLRLTQEGSNRHAAGVEVLQPPLATERLSLQ